MTFLNLWRRHIENKTIKVLGSVKPVAKIFHGSKAVMIFNGVSIPGVLEGDIIGEDVEVEVETILVPGGIIIEEYK